MADAPLSLETPCKVNLFLAVEGRRADGYHLIATLFQPLRGGPSDKVELSLSGEPGIRVSSTLPGLPEGMDNVCAKAAKAYFDAAGLPPRASVRIEKRIPVAAGLGGGSSDAAATLLLLQREYRAFDSATLRHIAAKIGADVPFFLDPVASTARGIGDLLEPLPFDAPILPILLAFPRFPVSSAWAYKNLDREACASDPRSLQGAVDALRSGDLAHLAARMRNDLSHAVRRKFPLIGIVEERLRGSGALAAQVSGSGSTVFALYKDFRSKDAAKESLKADPNLSAIDFF